MYELDLDMNVSFKAFEIWIQNRTDSHASLLKSFKS